jgi:hypothetical protein
VSKHLAYSPVRGRAYQFVGSKLAYTGHAVLLSEIDASVWPLFHQQWVHHVGRQYRHWPWPSLIHDDRDDDPACFELAIQCQHQLCGLACGRGQQGTYCSIEFIEASPEPHALKGQITDIALQTLIVYTQLLARREVRIVQPSSWLAARLTAGKPAFSFVSVPGQAQYLSLKV